MSSLLLPQTANMSSFHGYLNIGEHEFRVAICEPKQAVGGKRKNPAKAEERYPLDLSSPAVFRTAKEGREEDQENQAGSSEEFLWAEPACASLLAPFAAILRQRKKQCAGLEDLLVETQLIGNKATLSAPARNKPLPSPEYYRSLLHDLQEVGCVSGLSADLSSLSVAIEDSQGRVHSVEFLLPPNYPTAPPSFTVHCPSPLSLADVRSVSSIVGGLREELGRFSGFWEVMEDIDQATWVLEPAQPTRACCFRRVVLGSNLSLHVEVSPSRPREVCVCSFFGTEAAVAPLRVRWLANRHSWDPLQLPRVNLERILQVSFPPNSAESKEVFSLECGICYSFEGEGGGGPDQACENSKCGRGFHLSCLRDWLRAVPMSRQSFQTLFGECPYCFSPLSVCLQ